MFSESEAYERAMGRWSRRLARAFISFAGVQDGDSVLDVGCGTGSLTFTVAEEHPACRVVGVDSSGAYIEFATQRAEAEGVDAVHFVEGNALKLDFPDARFDRVLSLLVINFLRDPQLAVAELWRVTHHGGVAAACIWDRTDGMELLRIFWEEARAIDPEVGRTDISKRGELSELFGEAGFEQVTEEALGIDMKFTSFDDFWEPFPLGQGPAGAFTAALSQAKRQELEGRLRKRLLGEGPDGPITLKARAWAVRGTRPER